MPAKVIDGKKIAQELRQSITQRVAKLKKKPGLAVVLVGENPASQAYVGSKEKACKDAGFYSLRYDLPKNTSEKELLKLIDKLNKDNKVHGILVQLPLPKHIDEHNVIQSIAVEKDVDGLHPVNQGNLLAGKKALVPCTPKGIIKLIETVTSIEGKHAVVLGRSILVGKPVALLLLQKNATVTICHSKTKNLAELTKQADILVAAIGKPKMVSANMVKKGAVVIDVGTTRVHDETKPKGYGLCGDVDYEKAKDVAGFITPVPGGVGPMTIACLLDNTLEAYRNIEGKE